jgi:hypothetical protein
MPGLTRWALVTDRLRSRGRKHRCIAQSLVRIDRVSRAGIVAMLEFAGFSADRVSKHKEQMHGRWW